MSPVDDTDPIAGQTCRKVTVEEANVPHSRWNAFNQVLRLLLELP